MMTPFTCSILSGSVDDTNQFSECSLSPSRNLRPKWAEEMRMNIETFGISSRHRGRGGFRSRGSFGPRGGRGRPSNRGSFRPPRGAPSGFRGGFRGGRGHDVSDFEYRVKQLLKCTI